MNRICIRNFALSTVLCALIVAVFGSRSIPVLAQSATGQILGTVTDTTGAIIPNATVTVTLLRPMSPLG